MTERENNQDRVDRLRRSLQTGDLDGARRILGSANGEPCFTSRPMESSATPDQPGGAGVGDVLGGEEILVSTSRGQVACWRCEPDPGEIDPAGEDIAAMFTSCMKGGGERFDELRASPGLCHLADASEEQVVFLRSHSAGRSEGYVVVSRAVSRDGRLRISQRIARKGAEEPAVLQMFSDACEETGVLVMFGGRGDTPQTLAARMKTLGLDEPWAVPPTMLVRTDCKAMWADELPRFGLRVLERMGLGRSREGGFPASMLGRVVRRFRDTGNAKPMTKLLRRSAADLLTMIELCCLLLTGRGPVGAY